MFTRENYLNKECSHREYYAQFVTANTRNAVQSFIGLERLQNSTDQHLNDIHLNVWDRMPLYANTSLMKECGDWLSPAGKVCILKEAARQLIEKGED